MKERYMRLFILKTAVNHEGHEEREESMQNLRGSVFFVVKCFSQVYSLHDFFTPASYSLDHPARNHDTRFIEQPQRIASMNCDTTSGGVKIAPRMNAPTIT